LSGEASGARKNGYAKVFALFYAVYSSAAFPAPGRKPIQDSPAATFLQRVLTTLS
jgi:hypothetical protein